MIHFLLLYQLRSQNIIIKLSRLSHKIVNQCLRVHNPKVIFPNDIIGSFSTIVSPSMICQHCKTNIAEIFQENGDYCLNIDKYEYRK